MPEKPGKNREQLKEITDRIEAGIRDIFESGDMEKYRNYLRTMSRFHNYSLNNQALIHLQRPDATFVAGYNRWRDKFSRHVLRGEKGITIIAPTPYKKKIEQEKLDPDTKLPILDADGKIVTEEKEIEIPMFRPVKVFDYAQTDGKPLPERVASPVANLTGSVENYEAFMEALRRSAPVPVEFKPLSAEMDGYFSPKSQSIMLREGMSEVQTVSAAVHEIAHAKLHNYGLQQPEERRHKSRNTEEVEAESISFMVCAYFGIETGANSFGYVATWSKNAELPEFRASLDTISKTANGIITDVEKHFAEVCQERGVELPKDTEYELVTIPPSRTDALAFAADYAAFLRRGLNVPDSADKPTAEAVADRLLAGEDTELRKELEDFVKLADEIGIDDGSHGLLERFNGLFRQEWRAKEEPQPEDTTIVPGTPFTEDGIAATRDLLYDKHTNKQFITVETRNGHTLYIVIDYDKLLDEEEERYQTYFLNPVDEADLMALLEDDSQNTPVVCSCTEKCTAGKVNTNCALCKTDMTNCAGKEAMPEETEQPDEPTPEKKNNVGGILILVLILAAGGGGALWYFKLRKPKSSVKGGDELDEFDFDEDDEAEEYGDYEDADSASDPDEQENEE